MMLERLKKCLKCGKLVPIQEFCNHCGADLKNAAIYEVEDGKIMDQLPEEKLEEMERKGEKPNYEN